MVAKKVYVGVSGFSYPGWKGGFYPKESKSEDFLGFYSSRLDSVEINSSFYAQPSAAMLRTWSGKTGENFRFSFKAPRQVTHILKIGKGSIESAGRFSETLEALGPKRGPTLFQLPPYAKQDLELLDEFLSNTSTVKNKVFEFRHESWFGNSTIKLLDEHGVGFCIAESEDMKTPLWVTGGLAYFRLRKESYDMGAVDEWAKTIGKTSKGIPDTYVYLRHDDTGENAILAQRLSAKLQM